ncbi:hexose transporter [Klebsormidium nitens]|uniref:Hexose transporter n=1 Tax=Klebsormidium nitens TaxID=105231 RepID=A0A1Y1ILS1_KLENI|nr:hexose transporter [Klebsormidium nitens]|eukprot:GAQ91744.1 hexose transporter [Klebsormidium nitens]
MVFGDSHTTHSRRSSVRAAAADLEGRPDKSMTATGSVIPAVAIACLGALLFGYHLGVVNGALDYMSGELGFRGNTAISGLVVSITLAGAALGSVVGGNFAEKFGRTRALQINVLPLVVGAFVCATAGSTSMIIAGRLICGIGIGLSSTLVPLYISEVSPPNIRGALGSVNQLAICIGILGALLAGLPLSENPGWWRTMFGIAVIPAVLLGVGMAWAPESPSWLFKHGRSADAEAAVRKLWGAADAAGTIAELKDSALAGKGEEEAGWGDLFSKRYRKVTLIACALFLLQQFSGINAVVYFSTTVFRKAGVASDIAASALVGAANVFGTVAASAMMDSQGRKKLLQSSFLGQAAMMILLAAGLTLPALEAYSGTIAVVGTVLYVLAFSFGVGPVPGLLAGEILPARIRAKGVSLALFTHWACNFFIGLTFLALVNKFSIGQVYLGFAVVCIAAASFVSRFVVETKGRSLEDIEKLMASNV